MDADKLVDLFLRIRVPQGHGAGVGHAPQQGALQHGQPQVTDGLKIKPLLVTDTGRLILSITFQKVTRICIRATDLAGTEAKGFAGQVGGQTVENHVSTGGTGDDAAVIGIEGHAGHIIFMVLRTRGRKTEDYLNKDQDHQDLSNLALPTHLLFLLLLTLLLLLSPVKYCLNSALVLVLTLLLKVHAILNNIFRLFDELHMVCICCSALFVVLP